MSCIKNNTNERKNKQFSESERGNLEAYLNESKSIQYISEKLIRSRSSLYDEIDRNSTIKYRQKYISCHDCTKYENCTESDLCGKDYGLHKCHHCRGCEIAVKESCKKYEPINKFKCKKNNKKISCNGCKMMKECRQSRKTYYADKAQTKAEKRKEKSRPPLKILEDKELLVEINNKLNKKLSPDIVIHTIDFSNYNVKISVSTLYRYIDKGITEIKNIDLRVKMKLKIKKEKRIGRAGKHRENGRSIHDRPKEIETRQTIGHMEMDTVEGIKGSSLVQTILERKTDFVFGTKIKNKKQESIIETLNNMEQKAKETFTEFIETITPDNGVEFLNYEGLESSITEGIKRCDIYYADPYSSYQRGSNENVHRLFRYFIPKGKDISKFTTKQIHEIFNLINNYPRKRLGYSTPIKELAKELGDKGIEILNKLGYYVIEIEDLEMKMPKRVA